MKPTLSLGETTELAEEVACWREVLDQCTVGLTVLQPDLCEAVWRVDQFFQGLVHSLTRPSARLGRVLVFSLLIFVGGIYSVVLYKSCF